MKTIQNLFFALLAVGFLALAGTPALADDCVRLGGSINGAGECEIATSVSKSDATAPAGPYTINETLRIKSGKVITVPKTAGGAKLTINITGGLIMEVGSKIIGDVGASPNDTAAIAADITITATGNILLAGSHSDGARISSEQQAGSAGVGSAGDISLVSQGGNITIEDGAVVSVNAAKNPAGTIFIKTFNAGKIDIAGQVLSQSGLTGTGTNQRPGGGTITIIAGCELQIRDTGVVSSRGLDPGADLVHVEGCSVVIHGLVESTGPGHAIPNKPANHCNLNTAAHPVPTAPSTAYTGCVEVWSGSTITILNEPNGNNGEVNADIGFTGGPQGRGWIDLFARGDISITSLETKFAVHANGGISQNTDDAGLITVKSENGKLITVGNAIQANATTSGSKGGDIRIETSDDVQFGTALIQAKGSSSSVGAGGHISARSYNGVVSGTLPGELNASGGTSAATFGTITLQGCGTPANNDGVTYSGKIELDNDLTPDTATIVADQCGGKPEVPSIPLGTCTDVCNPQEKDPVCQKASVQSVLNPITGRFPNNLGPDVIVRLDLNESIQKALDTAGDSNGDGYIIISVLKDDTGQLGGSTTESININRQYEKRFGLIACSVTLIDSKTDDGQPTAFIAPTASSPAGSAENIFVMDLHATGSEAEGWNVVGNNRYLRNVNAKKNATGVSFLGNGNIMHNGSAVENKGVGLLIKGTGNLADSTDSYDNGSHGVQLIGSNNTIKKMDIGDRGKGNGGDGLNVNGGANVLSENDVYASMGNGILVVGDKNQVSKNNVGDRTKENGGDGINVLGTGNTVSENDVFSNLGNGIVVLGGVNTLSKNQAGDRGDKANGKVGFVLGGGGSVTENTALGNLQGGFWFQSAGFTLKNNESGGTSSGSPNGIFQYKFDVAGNVNSGGNKANNVAITGATFAAGIK